ncbi:hypothetical protein HMPREF9094_2116 [Fusobacterium animalis ATCC 51191]|uniref:Uncharacterized protein n=1 Tax=Fusobacterium animalis ATCC 51191 TaxID=997347 RepID=F9EQB1_9FUSO|nr:hypothetical protein HMPREF9094_2116 [Fusobacterium animalis ATCC 51191]
MQIGNIYIWSFPLIIDNNIKGGIDQEKVHFSNNVHSLFFFQFSNI